MSEKAIDTTYRTVRMSKRLRSGFRKLRGSQSTTNQKLIEAAIKAQLPGLVRTLKELGFSEPGETVPARLPFSTKNGTLDKLARASHQVGVPATKLLNACVYAHISTEKRAKTSKR